MNKTTRNVLYAVVVILVILAVFYFAKQKETMCTSCGQGACNISGAGSFSSGVGGPLPVQTEQILGGLLPMQGTHYGAPRQAGTGGCHDAPCNGQDYGGCAGGCAGSCVGSYSASGTNGNKYIRGTTYSLPSGEAKTESETIVALNGGDMTDGAVKGVHEGLNPGPQYNWAQAGSYGGSGADAANFPYRSYSGYTHDLPPYSARGPSRASDARGPSHEGMANPQYEWDGDASYGASASTYPYYSYSGFHEGIYPTMSPLDDSHHW